MVKAVITNVTFSISALFLMSDETFASDRGPVRVNEYIIPSVFANALNQGVTVPVFIRYGDQADAPKSKQKIADAILSIKKDTFYVNKILLSEEQERPGLSLNLKQHLDDIQNRKISVNNLLAVSEGAYLALEPLSFYFELVVSEDALVASITPRSRIISDSSVQQVSNVLTYTLGSYHHKYDNTSNASSYITLDNTTGLGEHHFNINGSIYGVGTADTSGQIYRSMYELDFQGRRFAAGMVDSWNLQSIASMGALNSSRIYGMSYGNKSSTKTENDTLSLIPITVFLPAAGEVHIYRAGRLLSIQNFPMGSYEVDTSRLPFGIYSVDIDILVNGKVQNSRTAQINKTSARLTSVQSDLAWQAFGGMLQYNKTNNRNRRSDTRSEIETWISGGAISSKKDWLSGVTMKSTLYGFDNNVINESEIGVAFNQLITADQQLLTANDGTWSSMTMVSLNVPGGYGSLWANRQTGSVGGRLSMRNSDSLGIGATVNTGGITSLPGSLTVSRTDNKYAGNTYINADLSQSLLANRYASVSIRTGIQRYYYYNSDSIRDKYINLDISLPLTTWFSTGVSSENGNMLANASLRKSFDSNVINQAGASFSKRMESSREGSTRSDDFSATGFISYDTSLNSGTLSITQTSDNNRSLSLNSQGSIGWTKDTIALGKNMHSSGVMVNTNFRDEGSMIAKINGKPYTLTGKSNYISLPPYAEYKVELMNDKTSEHSIDIISGRKSSVVLYPGNISVIRPEVKQLVTVFGRVMTMTGEVLPFVDLHNHIGKTQADERGEFALDVDKRYPIITFVEADGRECEAEINLQNARGAVWIGDIQCQGLMRFTSKTEEHQHDKA